MAAPVHDDSSSDAGSPRRVGNYRLLGRLGEGGFGSVYEAWDTRLDRAVAIKLLRGDVASSAAANLLREARAASYLQHRAFVRVHELIEGVGIHALVMELVRGKTFGALVAEGPLPLERVLRLLRQCADALGDAHRAGFVHGDVKPSNLMVASDDQVRILDFGLARRIEQSTAQHSELGGGAGGTLAYMAPELLLGKDPHPGSDVYSLGMVMFEMLSGERPYAAYRGAVLAHAIVHGEDNPAALLGAVGDGRVMQLVARMIDRDPRARIARMDEVMRAIDDLLGRRPRARSANQDASLPASPTGAATPSTPSTPTAPTTAATPRARPLSGIVAVIALVAVGAWSLGYFVGERGKHAPIRPAPISAELAQVEAWLRAFDDKGNIDRAIATLDARLRVEPRHAGAAAFLAIAYCLKYAGDARDEAWLRRADAASQLALAADDQLALAHAARAWTLEFLGRLDEAAHEYARARVLEPDNFDALLGHARLLTRQQRYPEAEQLLDHAIARYPDERLFQDALGTLRYQRADYAGAEVAFRRSIALKPDNVYAYGNLNAALLRQDRTEEALAVLQQGLKIRPDGRLYSNLGTVLYARGRYLEAVDAFERAVSPEHGSPNDYLKWANLADALRWVPGREADAREAYARTLALIAPKLDTGANDATVLSRAALYHAKLDENERARELIAQALSLAPDNPDVRFRATVVSELGGDRAAAIAHAARALALGYPRRLLDAEPELIALRRDRRYPIIPKED